MTITSVDAESLLAIDVGTVHTRAVLFDVADDQYRFIASGQAPSTAGAPYRDINEGARQALEKLQEITGRSFFDEDGRFIIPSRADGAGVDGLVSTISTGPALHIVIAGLLSDISLESASRLANSTYGMVTEAIGLNDRRKSEVQIDAIIQAAPDLVILAGGTENGADRSVNKIMETVGLTCYLLPKEKRPVVLYAGNQAIVDKIKAGLEGFTTVKIAPNIRPAFEIEDLNPAESVLAEITKEMRIHQVGGAQSLNSLCSGQLTSNAHAFGRFVRFLSMIFKDTQKGVLGLDLGAASTVTAVAFGGRLNLNVHQMGMGSGITAALSDNGSLSEITQWLTQAVPEADIRDYLYQKTIYPGSVPDTTEAINIEYAAARQIIRKAARGIFTSRLVGPTFQGTVLSSGEGLSIPFEPILATGSVITQAPSIGQSLLMLLDGLQPIGVTTIFLDQNNLLSALGAIAEVNTILPVQVFESGALLNLGTVVSPISDARFGSVIMRLRLVRDDRTEHRLEITQGSLTVLPLAYGQTAQLLMEPVGNTSLGLTKPSRGVKIVGGALGAVIDARGRPIVLPTDNPRRRELIKKWIWTLGG